MLLELELNVSSRVVRFSIPCASRGSLLVYAFVIAVQWLIVINLLYMFSLCEGNTVIKPESDNSYFKLSWLRHFLLNKQIESADESRGLVRAVMS